MLLGFMKLQGHMQLAIALVSTRLYPQTAVDISRLCIVYGTHNGIVVIKEGAHDDVIDELEAMGHGACSKTPSLRDMSAACLVKCIL